MTLPRYDLDGIYFRVIRPSRPNPQNICFTDLTKREIDSLTDDYTAENWKQVSLHLYDRLRSLGDALTEQGFTLYNEEDD